MVSNASRRRLRHTPPSTCPLFIPFHLLLFIQNQIDDRMFMRRFLKSNMNSRDLSTPSTSSNQKTKTSWATILIPLSLSLSLPISIETTCLDLPHSSLTLRRPRSLRRPPPTRRTTSPPRRTSPPRSPETKCALRPDVLCSSCSWESLEKKSLKKMCKVVRINPLC